MLGQPRHVAAHHAGVHAELRLHELRAGVDLGLQDFGSQPGGGSIGLSAAPRKNRRGRRPCGPTAIRRVSRNSRAVSRSWRGSRSNTGLASGWSPALGSSPRSISRLRTPHAAALMRSLCNAMRLRSRQVSCRIGSMPFSTSMAAAVTAPRCARAPAPSVMLTASARPLSGIALASNSPRSVETGGVTSAVMTKRPAPACPAGSWSIASNVAKSSGPGKHNNGKSLGMRHAIGSSCFNPAKSLDEALARRDRRLHAGGAARGLGRADGGDAGADPARRESACIWWRCRPRACKPIC